MRMEHRAPCKQIFCPYIHPQSLAWGHKAIKFVLLKVVMLHIKLKGLERREQRSSIISESSHGVNEINGNGA